MAQIPGAVTFPLLLPLLIISGTFLNATTVNEDANERLSQFWRSVERISEKTADKLTAVGNVVEEIAFELERGHSMCYQIGESILRNGFHEKWSAQMLSSNRFPPESVLSSLISAQFTSTPNAQSCLSLSQMTFSEFPNATFDGQYCLVSLSAPPLTQQKSNSSFFKNDTNYFETIARNWMDSRRDVIIGFCVPSICDEEELQLLIEKYFEAYLHGIELKVSNCQTQNTHPRENALLFRVSTLILISIGLLNLLSTIACQCIKKGLPTNSSTLNQAYRLFGCFHLTANLKLVFSPRITQNFRYLNGIQFAFITMNIYFNCMNSPTIASVLLAPVFFTSAWLKTTFLTSASKSPKFISFIFSHLLKYEISIISIFCLTTFLQFYKTIPQNLSFAPIHFLFISNFEANFAHFWLFSNVFQFHFCNYFIIRFYQNPSMKICSFVVPIGIMFAIFLYATIIGKAQIPLIYGILYFTGIICALLKNDDKLGHHFWFKSLLSANVFQVLHQCSYEMFSMTAFLVSFNFNQAAFSGQLSQINQIQLFTNVYVQAIILSLCIIVLLKMPILNLLKLFKKAKPIAADLRFSNVEELRAFELIAKNGVNRNVIA